MRGAATPPLNVRMLLVLLPFCCCASFVIKSLERIASVCGHPGLFMDKFNVTSPSFFTHPLAGLVGGS